MPDDSLIANSSDQATHVAGVVSTGNISVMGQPNAGGMSATLANPTTYPPTGMQFLSSSSKNPVPLPVASTTIVVPATAPTPGYKTTEFWSVLAVVLATFLNQSGVLGQFQMDPQIVYSGMGLVLAYLATRWGLKAQGSNGANTLNTLLTTLQKTQTPAT